MNIKTYTYAAIVRREITSESYSTQLLQGVFKLDGNKDEALGVSVKEIKNNYSNHSIVDVIIMEVPD